MNDQLASAKKLIEHLITWGEITRCEFNSIADVQDWVAVFEKAGILHPSGTDIWSLAPELWGLFREEPEKAVRTVLFQVPDYRSYLISILAEGVVSAAKQGLHEEVEKWSGNELLPFLACINQMLNQIESDGKRIINQKADLIPALFAAFMERQTNWDSWNQLLLGQTARSQDLFDCVLKRFVPYANPVPSDN